MKQNLHKDLLSFSLFILGCQQNEHDGIKLSHILSKLGFRETTEKEADFIFVLACAVRQTAVDRIFGKMKNYTDKKFIISGCVLKSDIRKLSDKGALFWDFEKPEQLAKMLKLEPQKVIDLMDSGRCLTSSVPIMFGCDNFCSYCATPYTRGRERSRNFDDVVADVVKLIKKGEKEILLLGQNVNSYKIAQKDKSRIKTNKSDFTILLEALNNLPGDFKIAFTSNHPKDMSDDIIKAVAELPKIKKEIHLPLQSGSDKILKAMNRPYTRQQYLSIIDKILKTRANIAITTDVIIGFPGETDEDFMQTIEVFEKVGYTMAYINKYSPRVGTAAYKLGDPIPWSQKQLRWHKLNDVLSRTRR